MKKILLILAMIVFGTTVAMAQEKEPTEVKEETEIHTTIVKTDKGTTEKKTKVVTKETASVELDKRDKNKVNQDQVKSRKKVEKTVYVDNDNEDSYKFLTKETYYVSGDENYVFKPNNKGFDITFHKNNDHLIKIGKAWNSNTDGYYILNGQMNNGIGYFDANGNFAVEYYNKDTDQIEVKTYKLVNVE